MDIQEAKNISRKIHNTYKKIGNYSSAYIEVNKVEFINLLQYAMFLEEKLEENNISINTLQYENEK